MLTLFSADDHIIEHPDVWTSRLPRRHLDGCPRLISDDGQERWVYENELGPSVSMASASASLRDRAGPNEPRVDFPQTFAEMLPGCYDPSERSKDLLENGVVASVCFPSLPRFGGTLFIDFKDKALADLCVRAYNDFVLDEWCPGGPPGMYVPMAIIQLWNPDAAAHEIHRCVDRGVRAISMPENVVHFGLPSYYSDVWDPVWRACEETGTAICMHLATAGNMEQFQLSPEAGEAVVYAAASSTMSANALINLLFSPVCSKFPGLKVVLSESGVGWLPYTLERADVLWDRHHRGAPAEQRPSEIWRQNLFVCQVGERVGLGFLDHIGPEKVLWELDYPHPDTVWPYAQEHTRSVFEDAGTSSEHIEMITHRNAEEVFRWTPVDAQRATLTA